MQEKACGEWRRRMIAAEILRVTDRKRKIVLEDESSFVLYAGELRKYHIREGEEIPEEVLEEIHDDVLVKRAKLRCMNLLKTSDRTVRQLRDRLRHDGYPEEIAEKALDYVASYHYTDDERYAENYIRQQSGRKSRKVILLELEKRGVDSDVIREAFSAVGQENQANAPFLQESTDVGAIRKLIRKRGYDAAHASWDEQQKLTGYLMRKGFEAADIRSVLREFQGQD